MLTKYFVIIAHENVNTKMLTKYFVIITHKNVHKILC